MTMRTRHAVTAVALMAAVASACGGGSTGLVTGAGEAHSGLRRATASVDDAKVAAAVVDDFGLDLLRPSLGSGKGNIALSPWSIATAMAMVRAGAKGATASEIDAVLHIADPATIDQAMNGLDQQLAARNGSFPGSDGPSSLTIELSAANRAFVQNDLRVEAPFLDTLATSYGAGVGLVDYKAATEPARVAINRWVADRTHDKITELIGAGVLSTLTRLVLVNAVYLRADWAIPFRKDDTRDDTFHSPASDERVPFMHDTRAIGYATGDGWKAIELDYAGQQLAMTVLMPDAGRFDDVAAHLDTAMVQAATGTITQVELSLPKFDITKALMLKDQLSALGMPTAFTDSADFSAITTEVPLVLHDVVHQAVVTVDEKGTVAAAATAPVFDTTGAAADVKPFVVDRPFLFLLRDKPTGAILFAGQVVDPSSH